MIFLRVDERRFGEIALYVQLRGAHEICFIAAIFDCQGIQDHLGNATDDPGVLFREPKGTLLPTGGLDAGHKGFSLALLIEALTAGLSGLGRADRECGAVEVLRTDHDAGDRDRGLLRGPFAKVQRGDRRAPFPDGALDGLTCGFALRNFVDLGPVLAECARVLRRHGRLALIDVSEPVTDIRVETL